MTVASLLPNGFGLYDVYGNVEEWIHNWASSTFPYSMTDPLGATGGTQRITKGMYSHSAVKAFP